LVGAQPVGQLAQVPDLAEVDAELEQTMRVQRQRGAMIGVLVAWPRGYAFHGVVVGDERNRTRIRDPLLQPRVAPIEYRANVVDGFIRLAVELEQHLVEPGAEADEVALLYRDLVLLQHHHQVFVADHFARAAEVREQIDHHGAALHARARHVLPTEPRRPLVTAGRRLLAPSPAGPAPRPPQIVERPDNVLAGAEAVLEPHFALAIAVDIELLAD